MKQPHQVQRSGAPRALVIALTLAGAVGLTLGLTACGEKPQTAKSSAKKIDGKPWEAAARSEFAADGWQGGDQADWEQQLRRRNQGQNEYVRMAP